MKSSFEKFKPQFGDVNDSREEKLSKKIIQAQSAVNDAIENFEKSLNL